MKTIGLKELLVIPKLVSYKAFQILKTYFKFTIVVLDKLSGIKNLKEVFEEDIFPEFTFANLTPNLKIQFRKYWQI